jgi:3D-(3,5/4)-trihydroxycyclohexane-1,2-dione acylhydrolase (decyclizing)
MAEETMAKNTIRLTTAQALVRYLCNQFIEMDGVRAPLFGGVFAIFGHGNVTCLGEALEPVKDVLPTWRGQNEQSMAMAAIAYTRVKRRRQIMVAASSIGPGASNMLTAAAAAHTNRLPLLLLAGDTFLARRSDPVLQQVEHFHDPTTTVNDCFKAVTRYWDRVTHPGQIISSLPQAVALMLDPADCGPAFLGLCQDVQEMAFDYPAKFLEPTVHRIPRPRPDADQVRDAVALLKSAKRPLIVAGGGVRYSFAEEELAAFAEGHGIPVAETIAGKASLLHDHPAHLGNIGILGTAAANEMAADADVILAVGTRLADFITGSWTVFNRDGKFVSVNTTRFDATKHRALSVVGDARESLREITTGLGNWKSPAAWGERGRERVVTWNAMLDAAQAPGKGLPSYAQVVAVVNKAAGPSDLVVSSAGGVVGELVRGWRSKGLHTFDAEMGSSTMGYEIAAGWGAAMAEPKRNTFVMLGDGSYLMMNSDIYSSVLTGHKMIVVVCDNGGYAVINRLQNAKGSASFNNFIKDCRVKEPFNVDFTKHAEAMGALARKVANLAELPQALDWAKVADRTVVLSIAVSGFEWTPGDAWWDVGVPEVSESAEVRAAYAEQVAGRERQRNGV